MKSSAAKIEDFNANNLITRYQQGPYLLKCRNTTISLSFPQTQEELNMNVVQYLIKVDKNSMTQHDIKVELVTQDRAKEACHVLTVSFVKSNGVYTKIGATYDEVFEFFKLELQHSINDNLAIALTLKGKIIAVSLCHDMYDYPKLENNLWSEGKSKFIKFEKKQVDALEGHFTESNYERGVAVYADYTGLLPEYLSLGIGAMLLMETALLHKKRGYKVLYVTPTSEAILGFLTKLGCKVVKKHVSNEPGMEGTFYALLRGELKDFNPDEGKKKDIKPKL